MNREVENGTGGSTGKRSAARASRKIYLRMLICVDGRHVVMYLDEEHRIEENRDYISRVDSGRYESYTIDGYHAKACQFGTIALVTHTDKTAKQLYEAYKTRCEVEQAIDVVKTNLDADSSYMQSEQSLEAYTFINFIALQWYYIIREHLRQADKLSKFSPMHRGSRCCRKYGQSMSTANGQELS